MRTPAVLIPMFLALPACMSTTIETSTHKTTAVGVNIPFLYSGTTISSESRVQERPLPEPRAMPAHGVCLPGTWCDYYWSYGYPYAYAAPPSPPAK